VGFAAAGAVPLADKTEFKFESGTPGLMRYMRAPSIANAR